MGIWHGGKRRGTRREAYSLSGFEDVLDREVVEISAMVVDVVVIVAVYKSGRVSPVIVNGVESCEYFFSADVDASNFFSTRRLQIRDYLSDADGEHYAHFADTLPPF